MSGSVLGGQVKLPHSARREHNYYQKAVFKADLLIVENSNSRQGDSLDQQMSYHRKLTRRSAQDYAGEPSSEKRRYWLDVESLTRVSEL